MNIRDSIRIALVNFKKHKVRTFLSVLGVVVGILSVSLIVTLGQGVKSFVVSEVSAYGSNIIDITTKVPGESVVGTAVSRAKGVKVTTLKREDFEAIEKFDFVKAQSSFSMSRVWTSRGSKENRAYLFATGYQYLSLDNQAELKAGRYFSASEQKGIKKVAVLGLEAKQKLFGDGQALGKKFKLEGRSFKVIGVFKDRGEIAGFNYDDMINIPLDTGQKLIIGADHVVEGLVKIDPNVDSDLAMARIESLLRRRHQITDSAKDDFEVMSLEQALEIANTVTQSLNILLVFLAGVSLLVGGVGIMNIMLISLSERVREIGLRKALGAKNEDILGQFLVESTLLTTIGGGLGVILAFLLTVLISIVVSYIGLEWKITFPFLGLGLALLVSVLVGVIFGLYPARKASQLDPIEAIREK